MPNFDNWLASSKFKPATAADKAVAAWRRIQDKPTSISLNRDGIAQTAQTVRLEYDADAQQDKDETGKSFRRELVVFGVKDHPSMAVLDTDIKAGDRFAIGVEHFEVSNVIFTTGEIQAIARRIS